MVENQDTLSPECMANSHKLQETEHLTKELSVLSGERTRKLYICKQNQVSRDLLIILSTPNLWLFSIFFSEQ